MSWAGSSKLNFKLCFTFPLCMSVHSFLSLWSFPWFFFGRPLKGCPLKCGAPPPTPIFFQSIVWSPSGRWKEAWSGCYSFYSIYTGRIQGFVLSITCHLVETTHFFFGNHAKGCQTKSRQSEVDKWVWLKENPLEVLLDQARRRISMETNQKEHKSQLN